VQEIERSGGQLPQFVRQEVERLDKLACLTACIDIVCMHRMREENVKMAMLTVRNLPVEVHRALRVRAAQHGHSMEAEVREILESTVAPEGRVKLGSLLADIGRRAKLTNEEFDVFEQVRDKTPTRPVNFE
jgi:plasmid stability protein